MYYVLVIISCLASVLLILAVLLQSSKGEGLAGSIAGGAAGMGQVLGSRRSADLLGKITWWLGGGLLFMALVINLAFLPGKQTSEQRESIIQSSQQVAPTQVTTPDQLPPAALGGDNTTSTDAEKTE